MRRIMSLETRIVSQYEANRKWREAHLEQVRAYENERRTELRTRALAYYGGVRPQCAKCGESRPERLHLHGPAPYKGNVYEVVKREHYPRGYRVLCVDCGREVAVIRRAATMIRRAAHVP